MKNLLTMGCLLIMAVFLTGCGNTSTNGNVSSRQDASTKTSFSSKKMTQEEWLEKLTELSEKIQNGEITPEEAKEMNAKIQANIETTSEMMKRTLSNISQFDGMPRWAKALNITEPKGVSLVVEDSEIRKEWNGYSEGFTAVYNGDAEKLFSEAKRLAEELGLEVELEQEGLLIVSGDIDKYSVSITVADNGNGVEMIYVASDVSELGK